MSVLDIIIRYREALLGGLWVTIQMSLIIWIVGIIIGSLLGILASYFKEWVGSVSWLMSFILSSVPVLVLLFWFHYPLQELFHIVIDPFVTATFVITLVNIFAVADLVRGIMNEFPQQYIIAARVCGLSERQIIKEIQFPIISRQVLPGLLTIQVGMLQLTLFASLISVNELFRVAQQINAEIYLPIQIYTALAVFFLIICLPLNGLALYLKNKYTRNLSEN